jgi:hypothetical protein
MMDNAASRDMSIAPEETELASEEEVLPNRSRFKGIPILGGIWLLGAIADRIWFALDQSVPSWDEAEYLTGAMNYWRAFQQPQWFSGEWWTSLWQLSSKVPPLLYLSTAPFINFFGAGVDQSTLVNLLYSLVLLGSVYALSTRLFSVQVGLWAAGLCLLIPGLSMIRLTYLTDYPLVATVTLSFCWLTIWWSTDRKDLRAWGFAIAFGLTFGLALLVKQTALFFLDADPSTAVVLCCHVPGLFALVSDQLADCADFRETGDCGFCDRGRRSIAPEFGCLDLLSQAFAVTSLVACVYCGHCGLGFVLEKSRC